MPNFTVIIKHYKRKHWQNTIDEINWFRSQSSLIQVIELAAIAKDHRGKRYSHQWSIKPLALDKAKTVLLTMTNSFQQCGSFEQVHELVKTKLHKICGIGELYFYDTSFRIGAKLNLLPEKVYLHRGVREGASALGLDIAGYAIEMDTLPDELKHLPPYEVEDILCIYKDQFN
ncbi:hypothetical protein [Nostoc sphaeroides]|uniref:Uncharacterized protein n=1 Tax=Nostoc sphaeroides CCNUC1 TaxID=2653204 RepID=A0A5P8W3S7_9NOSO|nr:hypothetical protein [Nostoc sphaeroides]QFS47363.1 hypothetical protein GXM_04853 [Nostoc sphaeroides CCNUC1]